MGAGSIANQQALPHTTKVQFITTSASDNSSFDVVTNQANLTSRNVSIKKITVKPENSFQLNNNIDREHAHQIPNAKSANSFRQVDSQVSEFELEESNEFEDIAINNVTTSASTFHNRRFSTHSPGKIAMQQQRRGSENFHGSSHEDDETTSLLSYGDEENAIQHQDEDFEGIEELSLSPTHTLLPTLNSGSHSNTVHKSNGMGNYGSKPLSAIKETRSEKHDDNSSDEDNHFEEYNRYHQQIYKNMANGFNILSDMPSTRVKNPYFYEVDDSGLSNLHRQKLWSLAHNAQLEREVEALQKHLVKIDQVLQEDSNLSKSTSPSKIQPLKQQDQYNTIQHDDFIKKTRYSSRPSRIFGHKSIDSSRQLDDNNDSDTSPSGIRSKSHYLQHNEDSSDGENKPNKPRTKMKLSNNSMLNYDSSDTENEDNNRSKPSINIKPIFISKATSSKETSTGTLIQTSNANLTDNHNNTNVNTNSETRATYRPRFSRNTQKQDLMNINNSNSTSSSSSITLNSIEAIRKNDMNTRFNRRLTRNSIDNSNNSHSSTQRAIKDSSTISDEDNDISIKSRKPIADNYRVGELQEKRILKPRLHNLNSSSNLPSNPADNQQLRNVKPHVISSLLSSTTIEKCWSDGIESRWLEVRFLLRKPIESEADMRFTIAATESGLLFIDQLNNVAKSLNVLRGTLSRWILPYDHNTRIDEQCSTPHSVMENIPSNYRNKITERQVHYLVSGANSVRQLIRIKIADDNDLEQARRGLITSKEFFVLLDHESEILSKTSYELLQLLQSR